MEFNEADSEEDRRHKLRTLQIYNKSVWCGGYGWRMAEVGGKAGRCRAEGSRGAETKWGLSHCIKGGTLPSPI